MAKSKKLKMELDFDGLLQILAKNLYKTRFTIKRGKLRFEKKYIKSSQRA